MSRPVVIVIVLLALGLGGYLYMIGQEPGAEATPPEAAAPTN